jgi:hypothetical protein
MRTKVVFVGLAVLLGHVPALAAGNLQEPITVDGKVFPSWSEFFQSDHFKQNGKRCGTPDFVDGADFPPSDCSLGSTNPFPPEYAPGEVCEIPTVIHILHSATGQGNISDELARSQIDILNEDYRALAGTPGAPGTDVTVQFVLPTVDPEGNPSTGITRTANEFWFADQLDPLNGNYWETLSWDPHRYLNIYTNLPMGAGGAILGYVPFFPQEGAGSPEDRVVCLYSSVGRNSGNPPYDQGRTATHEVGHWLGLFHTFQDGCGDGAEPGCYSTGDRICDTPGQTGSHGGCPIGTDECAGDSGPDPIHNYMEYTDDTCMNNFSSEQARRIRCTLIHYRPEVCNPVTVSTLEPAPVTGYQLSQNQPNPFHPATEFTFDLPREGNVALTVLDVNGRRVTTLARGFMPSGRHRLSWDGTRDGQVRVAAGVYFYQLATDEGTQTRRMVLMK